MAQLNAAVSPITRRIVRSINRRLGINIVRLFHKREDQIGLPSLGNLFANEIVGALSLAGTQPGRRFRKQT